TVEGLTTRTYLSNGDGSFRLVRDVHGDGNFVFTNLIQVGDFNGDGRDDYLLVHHDATLGLTIHTQLSIGDGTYRPIPQVLGDGAFVLANPVQVGDFNGDGRDDLAFGFTFGEVLLRTQLSNLSGESWTAYQQGIGGVGADSLNGGSGNDTLFGG